MEVYFASLPETCVWLLNDYEQARVICVNIIFKIFITGISRITLETLTKHVDCSLPNI